MSRANKPRKGFGKAAALGLSSREELFLTVIVDLTRALRERATNQAEFALILEAEKCVYKFNPEKK